MEWLFDAAVFMTRSHCGRWSNLLIGINQAANFLIAVAYFSIPLSLWVFRTKIRGGETLNRVVNEQSWIIILFILFIALCGLTHLMDVLAFNWAPYRLFTLIDVLTAAASIPTALLLPHVIEKIIMEAQNADDERN